MNHHIYHLHQSELPSPLCYQLQPLISAYRPHDNPPSKELLDATHYKPNESPLSKENILDTYKSIKYNQDLSWLEMKRKYNSKFTSHRTYERT